MSRLARALDNVLKTDQYIDIDFGQPRVTSTALGKNESPT